MVHNNWLFFVGLILVSFFLPLMAVSHFCIRTMLGLINAGDNDRLTEIAEKGELDPVQLQTVYAIFKDNTAIKQLAIADECLQVV